METGYVNLTGTWDQLKCAATKSCDFFTGSVLGIDYDGSTLQDGDILQYDGFNNEWNSVTTASSTPGGANGQVQYNDNGNFGANSNLAFDSSSKSLSVGGNIEIGPGNSGFGFVDFKTGAGDNNVRIGQKISGTTVYPYTVSISASGSNIGHLEVEGDVTAYASSDERLKDNIKVISDPISKIKKLRGVEFDWNGEAIKYGHLHGHDIGVIAQDVNAVFPEIVSSREDGIMAVRYDKLHALLIEAVKEQQNQIEELKKLINSKNV